MGIYSEYAKKYWENGFITVPCEGKAPKVAEWQQWPDDESGRLNKLSKYIKQKPNSNVGLVLGALNNLIAIDVDVLDDNEFMNDLLELIPLSMYRKKGKKGVTLFYEYDGNRAEKSKVFWKGDNKYQLEILSTGNQTVLPPSIHPENNQQYRWVSELNFNNTSFHDLDLVKINNDKIFQIFEDVCKKHNLSNKKPKSSNIDASRNDRLKKIVVAMFSRGEGFDKVLSEILLADKLHNIPLFGDQLEFSNKDPIANAKTFVNNILNSLKNNKVKLEAPKPYDISKKNGFFLVVPKLNQKNEEIFDSENNLVTKEVIDGEGMYQYFKHKYSFKANDSFYFKYQDGYYKSVENLELENMIRISSGRELTKSQVDHFKSNITSKSFIKSEDFVSPSGLINLKNGTLKIDNMSLMPHNPENYFKYKLEFDYNDKATCNRWLDFLYDVFDGNKELVDLSSEIFGYTILGGSPFLHKAFCLLGNGRNGKSVFLSILEALLSDKNCSAIPMNRIDDHFRLAQLDGKLANIVGETPTGEKIPNDVFKSLVAGDPVQVSLKNRDFYSMRPIARLFFACNSDPVFKDSSYGLQERLVFLPFGKTYSKKEIDLKLSEKLISTEMPGVLTWAIDGLNKLLNRGYLIESKISEEMKETFREDACSVYKFYKHRFSVVPDGEEGIPLVISTSSLYPAYLKFCSTQDGIIPKSAKTMIKEFRVRAAQEFGSKNVPNINGYYQTKCLKKKKDKMDEDLSKSDIKIHNYSNSNLSRLF